MKAILTFFSVFCIINCSLAQKGNDSISITADHMRVNETTGIITYTGNVSFKDRNNSIVKAEKLIYDRKKDKVIAYSGKGSNLKGTFKPKNVKDGKL